jgi:hypothetical protein
LVRAATRRAPMPRGAPLILSSDIAILFSRMKTVVSLLCLLALQCAAFAKEFKLYATLLEDIPVELADGAKWMMDKGDVFPVVMYKEMQRKIVLQLAGTNFWTDTKRVRILRDDEVAAGLANYRKNVNAYLESKSKAIKSNLEVPPKTEASTLTTE